MLKKTLFVGAAMTLLLGLCFGRNALSYVKTSVHKVSDTVKNSASSRNSWRTGMSPVMASASKGFADRESRWTGSLIDRIPVRRDC